MILLLAVLLFVSYSLYREIVSGNAGGNLLVAAEAQAPSFANTVNRFVNRQQELLNSIAARPLTASYLATNPEDRKRVENNLLSLFGSAENLYLISANDHEMEQRLNFVALDMARRVLSGESVSPEAMKDDQGWHIFLIAAIAGDPAGCLLASIPAEQLATHLTQISQQAGQVQVIQEYPGTTSQAFIAIGSPAPGAPEASANTALPYWKIRFTPGVQLAQSLQPEFSEMLIFYSTLAITFAVFIWIMVRVFLKYRAALANRIEKKDTLQHELSETPSFAPGTPKSKEAGGEQSTDAEPGREADSDVFDLGEGEPQVARSGDEPEAKNPAEPPEAVFRAYDIRGVYGSQLSDAFAGQLGQAIGTLALERNETTIAVVHDGRVSSPALYESLLAGIRSSGCDVIALGMAPTPMVNFAIHHLDETSSGVSVTASHNPPEYNGFKVTIAGEPVCGDKLRTLYQRIKDNDLATGEGSRRALNLRQEYIERIAGDSVPAHDLHVVVDAANGVAGIIAPVLLERLGCKVTPVYCDVDGNFPNHPPDTSVAANLRDLISVVKHQKAHLGFAYDGDGDRLIAVTGSGRIVWPDELLMIFARDVLARQPGADIVFDVKCSRRLGTLIGAYGGRPVMWKTGHSHMRKKIAEVNAPLGGEYSGHLFFNDRWYGFDDGLYASARLIEIISLREQSLDDMVDTLPRSASTDELRITVPEQDKFDLIEKLITKGDFKDGKLTTLDGLRVDFANSWGLVRASNTSPAITLRFEGETPADLKAARTLIGEQLLAIEPELAIEEIIMEKEHVLES